jgi:hypothetical protein
LTFPVSVLVGFGSDETTEEEVGDVLLCMLKVTGLYTAGSISNREERKEITTFEEDLGLLRSNGPHLLIYRRNLTSGVYEIERDCPQDPKDSDGSISHPGSEQFLSETIEDFLGEEIDSEEPDNDPC